MNFLSWWFAISGKSCNLFYSDVTKQRESFVKKWMNAKILKQLLKSVSSVLSFSGLQTRSQFWGIFQEIGLINKKET